MNAPRFNNQYKALPDQLYVRQTPVPVAQPQMFALNAPLAADLGLDPDWLASEAGLAMLAGNAVPDTAHPIAQAYAGHQFGNWVPQLGDGRAVLIGELDTADGRHVDVQLKGAGRTPFSRGGDGRAALGPVIREYLVSEAMATLGVPTTRALAAVTTGEPVYRETPLPGAVLTRIASSHMRVGTFQYFAARQDNEALRALTEHAIERHYPDASDALDLLREVVAAQARLVARWMTLGFVHGVMNTDNMTISGETIDYGPCAFLDEYHPAKVFSSIDRYGRYAFAAQPNIAGWNLAQLASSLLPLIGEGDSAIEAATEAVNRIGPHFQAAWLEGFGAKIGLAQATAADMPLIEALLSGMADHGLDFTQTFHALGSDQTPEPLSEWARAWRDRLAAETRDPFDLMRRVNPFIIPRNHRVEEAIAAAYDGDSAPFEALHRALSTPFDVTAETEIYSLPPSESERVTQTFCGT